LIGKNAQKIFVSEADNSNVKNKNKLRKQGKSDMYEVLVKNKNGELKWWMISGAPNYDEKGNLIGSIGIHLDITDQKQLELDLELSKRKAEESSKAKEAFLANMSHEIRTPLNAIIGMIRELSKEKLSELQDTYVQNTSIASQHLLSVLNNILDISKIEAGELQLDLHHFDLQKILNDVKSIMLAKCGEKGLFLKINHVENKNVFFIGDSSRIRQILLNLIGNAVKFTNTGGITIEYDVQNLNPGYQTVYISVKDTGVGMDESYLQNIFNKFSQEDTSTSRKYGGSGLGMSITKELIELMNGVIEIKSKKNIGTTIHLKFLLPIGEPDKLLKEDFETIANNGRFLDILLVEDNEFNRLVAGNTLNHFNCTVTEAINGLEAINILKTGKIFDVILMDLQMPIMDGFESTKIIRNELKINTPIIALTANAFKSELEQCINIGMNDSVTKPFEEEKLINSIYKLTNFDSTNVNIEPTMLLNTDKLYNLHQLRIVSRNDTDYFKKMINIFIDQSNLSITQITESYLAKNLKGVYSVIHKIKPSIDLMGIEILKEPIKYIEKNAKEQIDSQELGKQIKFVFIILNKAILQLKEES
jgi:signal transduction histidine kinase/DNA-binding response OmpR family regulator